MQGRKTVWAFSMQLSWSKVTYIELADHRSPGTFVQCHINAFKYLGGVPRECFYLRGCNLAVETMADGGPSWSPGLKLLAAWTGFRPECWQPYMQSFQQRLPSPIETLRVMLPLATECRNLADLTHWVRSEIHEVQHYPQSGSEPSAFPELAARERDHLRRMPDKESNPGEITVQIRWDDTARVWNRIKLTLQGGQRIAVFLSRVGRVQQVWATVYGYHELVAHYCLDRSPDLGGNREYDDLILCRISELDPARVGHFFESLLRDPKGTYAYGLIFGPNFESFQVMIPTQEGQGHRQDSSYWRDEPGLHDIDMSRWVKLDLMRGTRKLRR